MDCIRAWDQSSNRPLLVPLLLCHSFTIKDLDLIASSFGIEARQLRQFVVFMASPENRFLLLTKSFSEGDHYEVLMPEDSWFSLEPSITDQDVSSLKILTESFFNAQTSHFPSAFLQMLKIVQMILF